jgi:hypothetical protein
MKWAIQFLKVIQEMLLPKIQHSEKFQKNLLLQNFHQNPKVARYK